MWWGGGGGGGNVRKIFVCHFLLVNLRQKHIFYFPVHSLYNLSAFRYFVTCSIVKSLFTLSFASPTPPLPSPLHPSPLHPSTPLPLHRTPIPCTTSNARSLSLLFRINLFTHDADLYRVILCHNYNLKTQKKQELEAENILFSNHSTHVLSEVPHTSSVTDMIRDTTPLLSASYSNLYICTTSIPYVFSGCSYLLPQYS